MHKVVSAGPHCCYTKHRWQLAQHKLAAIYTILWSMYTNICHTVCDPKGSHPVKLILSNSRTWARACGGVCGHAHVCVCVWERERARERELCVVKECMTKYMLDIACAVSTKFIQHVTGENTWNWTYLSQSSTFDGSSVRSLLYRAVFFDNCSSNWMPPANSWLSCTCCSWKWSILSVTLWYQM